MELIHRSPPLRAILAPHVPDLIDPPFCSAEVWKFLLSERPGLCQSDVRLHPVPYALDYWDPLASSLLYLDRLAEGLHPGAEFGLSAIHPYSCHLIYLD